MNGSGVAAVYDPKSGFNFKFGVQQSKTEATNLSQSLYSLGEIGYVARPPGARRRKLSLLVPDRQQRRTAYRTGYGLSLDQKAGVQQVTWFGRYGTAQADIKRDHFYSAGLQFANGAGFYPGDVWGVGYSHYDTGAGPKERLMEGYYNFWNFGKIPAVIPSHSCAGKRPGEETVGYLVPGIRLQASF